MYAKGKTFVTYFKDAEGKYTDKVFYGKVSEAIKKDKPDENGKNYEFETWYARFVGKAREKAAALEEKASITLLEWNTRNPYDKEKQKATAGVLILPTVVTGETREFDEELVKYLMTETGMKKKDVEDAFSCWILLCHTAVQYIALQNQKKSPDFHGMETTVYMARSACRASCLGALGLTYRTNGSPDWLTWFNGDGGRE